MKPRYTLPKECITSTKKTEALALQSEIDRLDQEIDEMVYELYGLTGEERMVVEGEL